jgi:hypothetical protein
MFPARNLIASLAASPASERPSLKRCVRGHLRVMNGDHRLEEVLSLQPAPELHGLARHAAETQEGLRRLLLDHTM